MASANPPPAEQQGVEYTDGPKIPQEGAEPGKGGAHLGEGHNEPNQTPVGSFYQDDPHAGPGDAAQAPAADAAPAAPAGGEAPKPTPAADPNASSESTDSIGGDVPVDVEAGQDAIGGDVPPDGDAGQGTPNGEQAAAGAPETYKEFKVPKGYALPNGALDSFTQLSRASGLNQDQAQAQMDFAVALHVRSLQTSEAANARQRAESNASGSKACREDADYGGEKFDATWRGINAALHHHCGGYEPKASLVNGLRKLGLTNDPGLFRFLASVGATARTDRTVSGSGPAPGDTNRTRPEGFYAQERA